jgi:hypothetical protein
MDCYEIEPSPQRLKMPNRSLNGQYKCVTCLHDHRSPEKGNINSLLMLRQRVAWRATWKCHLCDIRAWRDGRYKFDTYLNALRVWHKAWYKCFIYATRKSRITSYKTTYLRDLRKPSNRRHKSVQSLKQTSQLPDFDRLLCQHLGYKPHHS